MLQHLEYIGWDRSLGDNSLQRVGCSVSWAWRLNTDDVCQPRRKPIGGQGMVGKEQVGDSTAIGHIQVWIPVWAPPPSLESMGLSRAATQQHRPPWSEKASFSSIFAHQRNTVRHWGWLFLQKKNDTFYILHYMWLCKIYWYPDGVDVCMKYLVFGFLKMAWNKMYIHIRVTSVFATVMTNSLCCFFSLQVSFFLFCISFLLCF